MKIYQSLSKFGNLGKTGNLNFPVTEEIRHLCHVTTYGRVQERKENYKRGWRDATQHILNTVFFLATMVDSRFYLISN